MRLVRKALLIGCLAVLVASLTSCTDGQPRSAEPGAATAPITSDSYLGWLEEEAPASRRWADITTVTYTAESPTGGPWVEITGVAESSPSSGTVDAYVYASDGSSGPVTETTFVDGRFRVEVELPAQHTDRSLSRFEVIVIAGQYVFVDAREWLWAQEDGGTLRSVAGAP